MSDVMFPGRRRELVHFYTTGRPTCLRLLARRVARLVGLEPYTTNGYVTEILECTALIARRPASIA